MLIDVEESVDLNEEGNLADTMVGGMWFTFRSAIPPLQAKILDNAFNLIMLSDENSVLPSQIADVLANTDLDMPVKKQAVFVMLTVNTINLLTEMGVTLNQDVVGEDKLKELSKLLDFFLSLQDYQDLIGLKSLLECMDIPPVNRLLQAMQKLWGEDEDLSEYECMIEDISEVTLKAIKDTLFSPEEMANTPDNIVNRVIANKAFLEGTKAYDHLINNGQAGGTMPTYLNFFKDYLEELLAVNTVEANLAYAKEVLCFYLISEINDHWLKEKVSQYLYSVIEDITSITRIEEMIEGVIISE
jgi:hypothetical protein